MNYIGIDIGGTNIKFAILNEHLHICAKDDTPIDKSCPPQLIIKSLAGKINKLLLLSKIDLNSIGGVGVAMPGLINSARGKVLFSPNLQNFNGYKIEDEVKKYFPFPIKVCNDANAAALGEYHYNKKLHRYKNVVMLTLGTGVGSGIIINGQLFEGKNGTGAEIGHTKLIVDGLPCSCGEFGCAECYISASALKRDVKLAMERNKASKLWDIAKTLEEATAKTAFDAYKLNDESAVKIINNYIKYLTQTIINISNFLRPDAIVLGGGISNQGKNLLNLIDKYYASHNFGLKGAPKVKILIASLKNDAGVVGAAALTMNTQIHN